MPNITTNHAIICLYYYPQKVCNFHMQVFQIQLKYHCSKPIKLQKFPMQQYKRQNRDTLLPPHTPSHAFIFPSPRSPDDIKRPLPRRLVSLLGLRHASRVPTPCFWTINPSEITILCFVNWQLHYKNKLPSREITGARPDFIQWKIRLEVKTLKVNGMIRNRGRQCIPLRLNEIPFLFFSNCNLFNENLCSRQVNLVPNILLTFRVY